MEFADFHFLRPLWLWTLLPTGGLIWLLWRDQSVDRAWRGVMAPHLLQQLLVSGQTAQPKLRPVPVLALLWLIMIVALAGPTWQREPTPFAEDRAAVMIVLKVTPTMLAEDIQPSRLERAVQKIGDLLDRRKGAPAGLIAYSGSAHLVMPLTRDASIIGDFAAELSPKIMPVEGDAAAAAVRFASQQLADSGLPGSVLLMADSIVPDQLAELEGQQAQIYAFAAGPEVVPLPDSPPAPSLDRATMERAARAVGGDLTTVTVDDRDLDELEQRLESSINRTSAQEGERWRDAGYFLLPLLALFLLTWFRRGWKVSGAA